MDKIVGIGMASLDIMGVSTNRLVMEDMNPGTMETVIGGTARNIIENCAHLGLSTAFIGAVGNDEAGTEIESRCEYEGIGTHLFHSEEFETAKNMLIYRNDGEMAVALSDSRIMQTLTPQKLEEKQSLIETASIIVIDGSLPNETIRYITRIYGKRIPIFADPSCMAYARRMRLCLNGLHTVKPNCQEAEILSGISIRTEDDYFKAASAILDQGPEEVIITGGARGAFYADRMGQACWERVRPLSDGTRVTGAGDAFMAGLCYATLRKDYVVDKLHLALGAAVVALESDETIPHNLTPESMQQGYERQKNRRDTAVNAGKPRRKDYYGKQERFGN